MKPTRKIFNVLLYIFAIIGFVLVAVYIAVEFGFTKTSGIIDNQHGYFENIAKNGSSTDSTDATTTIVSTATWEQGQEWQVLKQALTKDATSIDKAAQVANVPARLIVAPLVVEQLRLFYSDREVFKQVFAPLQILGNQSQFSWGVMGIKQDTAKEIESNLIDTSSPWYLGPAYTHILDYTPENITTTSTSTDPNAERFYRLTDENNRYFSYLYAGLMMKEIETQWSNAGIPIDTMPDVVATLFNIGFQNSNPHPNPEVGGAEIDIGSTTYSFGGLAGDFYASNELTDVFPR